MPTHVEATDIVPESTCARGRLRVWGRGRIRVGVRVGVRVAIRVEVRAGA